MHKTIHPGFFCIPTFFYMSCSAITNILPFPNLYRISIHMGSYCCRLTSSRDSVSVAEDAFSQIMVENYRHLCQRTRLSKFIEIVSILVQRFIMFLLSAGPVPRHIAFIMDGNRRYAKKHKMEAGEGHVHGILALFSLLKHCYLLEVKYVTVYAFSIDNFKRPASEVGLLMNLMRGMIENIEEHHIITHYGVRVYFVGNLKLLDDSVRLAAERAMRVTAENNNATLVICVAYTCTDEISHAVEESCKRRLNGSKSTVHPLDIEKHMYMALVPDPDMLVRSSGESRLSNFLTWQTANTLLLTRRALWPEMRFKDLCWSVINFQRRYSYFESIRKQG